VFVVGGLASVIFGVLAFLRPGLAVFVLAMYFAASILVDGAFNAAGALGHRGKDGWWVMLLMGLLGLAVGGYALVNPPLSMMAFVYLVAIQAVLLGVFLVMLGYKVRKATTREWMLYTAGALSAALGLLVIANPLAGGVSIVYLVACWAVAVGALKVWFGLKVKNLGGRLGDKFSALG
jgi:uncharacterized membrane protein HdeD (DUF308 family)